MEEKRISPLKAIRLKCLDCSCGSSNEVKLCPVVKCPLYPFRDGHNPYTKKEYSPEERAALAARLTRNKPTNKDGETKNAPAEGKKPSSRINRKAPQGPARKEQE